MTREHEDVRKAVRQTYGDIAKGSDAAGCATASCCGGGAEATVDDVSRLLGYSEEELVEAPLGANLGLGCGNPQAIAQLKPGETVVDLGSGGGFDCFIAARKVGDRGRVIGVDMTPDMISKARENAEQAGFANVEFRLGEIEHLPVPDETADVLISNCVINLAPDKRRVYEDAYRALKPGGRLAISDVVATAPLPEEARRDLRLISGCVAGAAQIGELKETLSEIGFEEINIDPIDQSKEIIREWVPERKIGDYVVSATIEAKKPTA